MPLDDPHYVFKTFADESVDDKADAKVTLWLNDMYASGYVINAFQQEGRWNFFVMEKMSSAV
jgi:hypothetical protein